MNKRGMTGISEVYIRVEEEEEIPLSLFRNNPVSRARLLDNDADVYPRILTPKTPTSSSSANIRAGYEHAGPWGIYEEIPAAQ